MDKETLKDRTKRFALRIVKLVGVLPKTTAGRTIGNQLIRSGMSVASNYRAALRSRSRIEFIAKIGIVIEEADESVFWLEMIVEAALIKKELVASLLQENKEILAIMVSTKMSTLKNSK